MTDGLTVSGGGSVAVAPVELFESARRLLRVVMQLDSCVERLENIDDSMSLGELIWSAPAPFALGNEWRIGQARMSLWVASATARGLAGALLASAEAYGMAESGAEHLTQSLSAKLAYGLGAVFPHLAALLAPAVLPLAAGGAFAFSQLAPEERARILTRMLEHNDALTNPATVEFVRYAVMSADDFAAGAAGLSPIVMDVLGDEGLGLLGLTGAAGAAVLLAGPTGALVETPVRVSRVSTRTDQSVARSYAERAARIPSGDTQIRIDRYETAGQPDSFVVYLGGTKDLGLTAMTEPWDMTSNVNALAMGDAGSYRAAQEAMKLAGIDAESPVQFAGYSQGGLIASALARSGDYNAQGMFTVGGVVSQDLVPQGVDWVAIEHDDDVMPALGGVRRAPDAVVVRREVFAGEPVPSDTLLPAHELERYRETAAMLDGHRDGKTDRMLQRLNQLGAGATTVTSITYLAERVDRQSAG